MKTFTLGAASAANHRAARKFGDGVDLPWRSSRSFRAALEAPDNNIAGGPVWSARQRRLNPLGCGRRLRWVAVAFLASVPSCSSASVDAGYLGLEFGGDIGFVSGAQPVTGQVNVENGLGQGGRTGSPYGRVELAADGTFIGTGFFASAFAYDNQGAGVLTASYGNIVAGTAVRSDFNLVNAKAGVYLSFNIADTVFIRPGIAADVFLPDLVVETTQLNPMISERIDDPLAVPLPYLQVGVDFGPVAGFIEAGYLPLDTEKLDLGSDYEVDTRTLDIEAMVRVRPVPFAELFAGYRLFKLQADGRLNDDTVDIDIDIGGFMIGGGLYW